MVNGIALPHSLIRQIVQRAGGNPFFLEEVVRSLFEQGAIIRREGGFEVTEKAHAVIIPSTITDVLMARIDRLEEGTRHLVKVASVLGRSFFLRILSKVASDIDDIPARLSHLCEIQILQPQERMGEVEYVFRHALAQEAAYESLLPSRKKELHLQVAHAIEEIFSGRLPAFYGMLAYHYSRAEDREKTEKYLIKAGEEALRSAASDEALHYYREALQLYLQKSGKDADPEKEAVLEKNIALALYNRGQHQEAIKYFDKALDYYWGTLPKNGFLLGVKVLWAFLHLLIALYLPPLKFRKVPGERDTEIVNLFFKKNKSLSVVDAKRLFIESFYLVKFISAFDLQKLTDGIGIFAAASGLFSYLGICFPMSRKVLNAIKDMVSQDDVRNYTLYDLCETVQHFLGGNWRALRDYDDDLVDKNCRIGKIYEASQHLYWHALGNICQGSFDRASSIVSRLDNLFEVYRNDLSKIFKHEVNTWLLIESGKLDDAMVESERGIDFEEKAHSGFWELHVCQAWIHVMMGAAQKAQECLQRADSIRLRTQTAPFQLSSHFKTQLELDLLRLRESMERGDPEEVHQLRRKVIRSSMRFRRVARRVAYHRTDSYRLTGSYYWAIQRQKRALRWWRRAVQEGERLGARPQLARLYFEIGRCLLESRGKYMKLNGLKAAGYLKKARGLFEEMGMDSALEELGRVVG